MIKQFSFVIVKKISQLLSCCKISLLFCNWLFKLSIKRLFYYLLQMDCKRWVDFGSKKRCPTYRLINCPTPNYPPACPLIDDKPKATCVRWTCKPETSSVIPETQSRSNFSLTEFLRSTWPSSTTTVSPSSYPPNDPDHSKQLEVIWF